MISFCVDITLINNILAQRNIIIITDKFCDFLLMILKIKTDKNTLDALTMYVSFLSFDTVYIIYFFGKKVNHNSKTVWNFPTNVHDFFA